MMNKVCPKCGKELEIDNFCMHCMEFARLDQQESGDGRAENNDVSVVDEYIKSEETLVKLSEPNSANNYSGLDDSSMENNYSYLNNSNPNNDFSQIYDSNPVNKSSKVYEYSHINDDNTLNKNRTETNDNNNQNIPYHYNIENKSSSTTVSRYMLTIAAILSIILIGACAMSLLKNNKVMTDIQNSITSRVDNSDKNNDVLKSFVANLESDDENIYRSDSADGADSSYYSDDTSLSKSYDGVTITEVDYKDIMRKGEPSTGYHLYNIMADDMVGELNDYIHSMETCEISYDDTFSDNYIATYEDGNEYTYYETFCFWYYEDGSNDIFYLLKDTVTGNLLGAVVKSKDFNRAAGLMEKAFEMVEGGATKDDESYLMIQLDKSHMSDETSFEYLDQKFYGSESDNGYIYFEMYYNK